MGGGFLASGGPAGIRGTGPPGDESSFEGCVFHHVTRLHATAACSASPSFAASSTDSSTTSLPPPSNGTRITMPRPSLVTSSGPSPVRGFIAAILHPLPSAPAHHTESPPAAEPVSNNRV